MYHPHLYRQTKARKDSLPQYYCTKMQQRTAGSDHHHLCHVQQVTPYPKDKHHFYLNDNKSDAVEPQPYHACRALSTKKMVHCYFCPHFQGRDDCLKMNNLESNLRVQHHKIGYHDRREIKCIHLQPRFKSPDSSEYEEHNYHAGHDHTQGIHPNERQHCPATVKNIHPKSPNGLFDRVHHHAAPQAPGTCAGATVCSSHEDGCGRNIKAVRFEQDSRMPEYTETHHSDCPIHPTLSSMEDQCHSDRDPHHYQSQSRESRTYRWVWGPPLPTVVRRNGKIYHAENN